MYIVAKGNIAHNEKYLRFHCFQEFVCCRDDRKRLRIWERVKGVYSNNRTLTDPIETTSCNQIEEQRQILKSILHPV